MIIKELIVNFRELYDGYCYIDTLKPHSSLISFLLKKRIQSDIIHNPRIHSGVSSSSPLRAVSMVSRAVFLSLGALHGEGGSLMRGWHRNTPDEVQCFPAWCGFP